MHRPILFWFFLLTYSNLFSQINYYVGLDLLSTSAKIIENGTGNNQTNINYSTYIGNEVLLNNKLSVFVDIVYQNNKSVLRRINELNTRFELHQTISLLIKPSLKLNGFSVGPILGVSGVYVFDKKEDTGGQVDRFDEGYLLGVNFNKSTSSKASINLSLIHNVFESISHYTPAKLANYNTVSLGIQYNLFGQNEEK